MPRVEDVDRDRRVAAQLELRLARLHSARGEGEVKTRFP
jgi:hypothetical protein